jgi:hypothetical protein
MNQLERKYETTRKDLRKDKLLKVGAWSLPVALPFVPTLVFFLLFLFANTTPAAAFWLFFTLASLIGGFFLGLLFSGGLMFYRSRWLAKVREKIAVDGIRADELDWFMHELTPAERKSLKEIEARSLLMGDAYRDSLAARLTATRILKTAKKELALNRRQQNKLKYSKAENAETFRNELQRDFEKLSKIRNEAEQMKLEAEKRLHQIETAARYGTNFSETEFTLKKLSARTAELPLALESAKMEEAIRKELEKEDEPASF